MVDDVASVEAEVVGLGDAFHEFVVTALWGFEYPGELFDSFPIRGLEVVLKFGGSDDDEVGLSDFYAGE